MSSNARREEKRREREAQEAREQEVRHQRWEDLWFVPEDARSEYLDMEDVLGDGPAKAVFDFVKAFAEANVADRN